MYITDTEEQAYQAAWVLATLQDGSWGLWMGNGSKYEFLCQEGCLDMSHASHHAVSSSLHFAGEGRVSAAEGLKYLADG